MTLDGFLRDRIVEAAAAAEAMDEHYAPFEREWEWCPRARLEPLGDLGGGPGAPCECACPQAKRRALAECAAKLAVLELLDDVVIGWDELDVGYSPEDWLAKRAALAMALPYADHDEYDPAWRRDRDRTVTK